LYNPEKNASRSKAFKHLNKINNEKINRESPVSKESKLFIITGEPGQGKTTLLSQTLKLLSEYKLPYSGILAPGKIKKGTRYGFSVKNLQSGEAIELCNKENKSWIQHGPFYFNPEGIAFGKKALEASEKGTTELVVLDEIGLFELKGKVWAEAADSLSAIPGLSMLWVVRKSLLEPVHKRWNFKKSRVFEVGKDSPSEIAEEIFRNLKL